MNESIVELMAVIFVVAIAGWIGFELLDDYVVSYLDNKEQGRMHVLAGAFIMIAQSILTYVSEFEDIYNNYMVVLMIGTLVYAIVIWRYVHHYYRRIKLFKDSGIVFSDESVEVTIKVSEPVEKEEK